MAIGGTRSAQKPTGAGTPAERAARQMTANNATHRGFLNPGTGDEQRDGFHKGTCGLSGRRVTASISRTETGELVTEYEVAGCVYRSVDELEAALRGEADVE